MIAETLRTRPNELYRNEKTMGVRHGFTCTNCEYTCEVSGGKDRGMRSRTDTFVCKDCKIVQDIAINKEGADDKTINELCCEKCKGNNLELWGENIGRLSKPCPKCNATMKMTRPMNVMWD